MSVSSLVLASSGATRLLEGAVWYPNNSLKLADDFFGPLDATCIAWGGTKFVAAGVLGRCATSVDGVTWAKAPGFSGFGINNVNSIAWSGSAFVAVGNAGCAARSTDGFTWQSLEGMKYAAMGKTVANLVSVVWAGSKFVVVGTNGVCYTSPDGLTWTYQDGFSFARSNFFGATYPSRLVWAGSKFLLVGLSKVATSADGITWAGSLSYSNLAINEYHSRAAVWTGAKFITVGRGGGCLLSSDGITWTKPVSSLPNQDFSSIAWSGTYAVTASYADAYRTPDGITWTRFYHGLHNDSSTRVAYGSSKFIILGSTGKCLTSTDGSVWVNQTSFATAFSASVQVQDVIWTGSQFVAIGLGKCATSPDGITWTGRTGFATAFGTTYTPMSLAWSGSLLVVAGINGTCATSPDGITWTARTGISTLFPSAEVSCLSYGSSKFVLVVHTGRCATSTDGITWTERTSLYTGNVAFNGGNPTTLAWSGSTLMAVGATASPCATSTDGVTWTDRPGLRAAAPNKWFSALAWGNSKFVAINQDAPAGVFTSPDGVTWTSISHGTSMSSVYGVHWMGSRFVTTNPQMACYKSTDGVTWTYDFPFFLAHNAEGASHSDYRQGAAFNGSRAVIVGDNGGCVTTTDFNAWTYQIEFGRRATTGNWTPITALAWSGSYFIVGGNNGDLATSSNGVDWVYRKGLKTLAGTSGVAGLATNGSVVVAGYGSKLGYSLDSGLTWTQASGISGIFPNRVTYAGGLFIATSAQSGSNVCYTSLDGISWTARWPGPSNTSVPAVVHTGSKFVALVGNSASVSTSVSTNGFVSGNVTNTGLLITFSNDFIPAVLGWGNSTLVAIGYSGKCATSPDGVTWTSRPGFSSVWGAVDIPNSIAWTGSVFIVVGPGGKCVTSPDGITWTLNNAFTTVFGAYNVSGLLANQTIGVFAVGAEGSMAASY